MLPVPQVIITFKLYFNLITQIWILVLYDTGIAVLEGNILINIYRLKMTSWQIPTIDYGRLDIKVLYHCNLERKIKIWPTIAGYL